MKKQKKDYKKFNVIFGILMVAMVGVLVYCGLNVKSAADKEYLDLQDHLLGRFIELNYQKEGQVCKMEGHGLSKDFEVSVRFWCQSYDADTDQLTGEREYRTVYFQHPKTIDGGTTGYAEALRIY